MQLTEKELAAIGTATHKNFGKRGRKQVLLKHFEVTSSRYLTRDQAEEIFTFLPKGNPDPEYLAMIYKKVNDIE